MNYQGVENQNSSSWDLGKAKKLILNLRFVLRRLVRFLTDHAFLRWQNNVVFHAISPPPSDRLCRMCQYPDKDDTPHHLIMECVALCHSRQFTLGSILLVEYENSFEFEKDLGPALDITI